MIKRGHLIEYSQSSSFSIGTSLEVVETIHELNRICLMTVTYTGIKLLKSKHFPAKYVLLSSSPPTPTPPASKNSETTESCQDQSQSQQPVSEPQAKPESQPEPQAQQPTSLTVNEEQKTELLYDLELKDEANVLETLYSKFIHWFPELIS